MAWPEAFAIVGSIGAICIVLAVLLWRGCHALPLLRRK